MKRNIHSADRTIRLLIGIIAAILFFTNIVTGTVGIILLVSGAVLFLTALINFCPIYFALDISTYKNKK